ncbi:MAG: primosomal protein N' [Oscillospiraceae bacterium]|nr:primosomal protein N' [Oscillospiraceae bacterium]
MSDDLICQVAVSSATYAIDKPYTYFVPENYADRAAPGMRVVVPFGKGNRHVEGMLLSVQTGERTKGVKPILSLLDGEPLLSPEQIQLALWMRERYFCTVYDAVKAMLPSGLYYSIKDVYRLTDGIDKERAYAASSRPAAQKVLDLLYASDGRMEKGTLYSAFFDANPSKALKELEGAGVIWIDTAASRAVADKQEQLAALCVDAAEALSKLPPQAASQRAIIRLLADLPEVSVKDIKYFTGASIRSVKALEKRGIIRLELREVFRRPHVQEVPPQSPPKLNDGQQRCFDGLDALARAGKPACALLYGVTGSGKTQFYIRLIHSALARGKTALVLVPEIALTPQMMAHFTAQFGDEVAILHSMLSAGERYDEWKRIRSGRARVVVGTRSAVFAPLQDLGLLVLDEEQEGSYKSENTPRYHARDVAKYRAAKERALLVLGSATPTVETMFFAKSGKYHLFELRTRYNQQELPRVIVSDLKENLRAGSASILGEELKRELGENLRRGEQSILFINRRGSSRMVVCIECGASPACPRCTTTLTYHKANGRLMCHYCGYSQAMPSNCPSCGGDIYFSGAGTQKVQEEVEELFPGIEVMRLDTDTVSVSHPHEKMLERFRHQKIPVLVGTQMVAKGLDFESVTLVGVICADQSLYVDNYRASERTFSLLTQVVGRAGRGERSGRAVIQTYTPKNDVILCAAQQDYDRFYESEIELRQARGLPPYRDMYVITVSGPDEGAVLRCCMRVADGLRAWRDTPEMAECDLQILGPSAAPVLMVNLRYRYRITVLGRSGNRVHRMVGFILKSAHADPLNRGVSVTADRNPMD